MTTTAAVLYTPEDWSKDARFVFAPDGMVAACDLDAAISMAADHSLPVATRMRRHALNIILERWGNSRGETIEAFNRHRETTYADVYSVAVETDRRTEA